METITLDLGTSPDGTFFAGGTYTSWVTQGSVPFNAFLKTVSIDTLLESTDNGNWTCELAVLFDPTPGTPGTDGVLTVGPYYMADSYMLSGIVSDQNAFWNGGDNGVGTQLVDTKTAGTDWVGNINLSDYGVFLANTYGAAPAGGTWSGTVTLGYDLALAWNGGAAQRPLPTAPAHGTEQTQTGGTPPPRPGPTVPSPFSVSVVAQPATWPSKARSHHRPWCLTRPVAAPTGLPRGPVG